MENIITPRSEIKVASQSEINRRKILTRTEYESEILSNILKDIDFQIKNKAEEGNKWCIYNVYHCPFVNEKLPYPDIYDDIINELRFKGYIVEKHKIFLSKQEVISIVIEEDVIEVGRIDDLPEIIDWNERAINKYIKRQGKFNLEIYLTFYGGIVFTLILIILIMIYL